MRPATPTTIALLVLAAPLHAQVRVETGGGESRLDELPATSLTSVAGWADGTFGRLRLQFSGTAEDHFGLGIAGMLSGGVSYRLSNGAWRVEIGPVSQAARGIAEQWAGTLAADVHASRDIGRLTVQAGWEHGVAQVRSQHAFWHRPDVTAEFRMGAVQLATSWQSTVVQDSTLLTSGVAPMADARIDTLNRSSVRNIQDLTARMGLSAGGLSVTARIGRRFGAGTVPQTWWEGGASLRLTPIMSATLRTGRLAADPLLGLRGGRYSTLGVRLDLLQHNVRNASMTATAHAAAEIVRESETSVHLVFVLPPDAHRVSLTGDPTNWHPIALTRTEDGRWEITLPAKPGVFRLNVRVDNGPWRAPPGLPATDDGFGAKVGLLVLER